MSKDIWRQLSEATDEEFVLERMELLELCLERLEQSLWNQEAEAAEALLECLEMTLEGCYLWLEGDALGARGWWGRARPIAVKVEDGLETVLSLSA